MESVKTIRAVERAFDVLQALQHTPQGATLVELEAATGLSGPTLLRLLKTLIGAKAVRRSTTDQRYRTSVQLHALGRGLSPVERLADLAAPWLDSLCRQVEWPSDLAVHTGEEDFMRVLESSLRQSRFYVRRSPGRVRVNLLGSAAGGAYLAALQDHRRDELIQAARVGDDIHNTKIARSEDLATRLQQVRARGYALRHPLYRGGSFEAKPRDDALQAMAVPVVHAGWVFGALNINWNRKAMTEREVVRRHLVALQAAAAGIAAAAAQQELHEELFRCGQAERCDWRT
jgi:IclR family transcriptional regulator, mhp operon transcriptional activator